jgi:hypothetical protein
MRKVVADLTIDNSILKEVPGETTEPGKEAPACRQAGGGGGRQAAAPANPVSNFTHGALGYFNAYAVKSKVIVIP